ncbi:MAG: PadR family transcriptional regulator [Candidatus Micrarchaeota archaeon]|nr:PadR family transcriptional regulator [Candidatus Micrarchaeota archaeon]
MKRDSGGRGEAEGPGCMHFFLKGFLEKLVLSEAGQKPTSGMDIMEFVKSATNGMWSPSPGAIYPLLARMEEEGLIRAALSAGGKGRRSIMYTATAAGKRKLETGKKRMFRNSEMMMRIMMPLMMRVMHGGDVEVAKLHELSDLISENRASMLSMPKKERERELDRMISVFKKIREDREKGK